MKKYKTIIIDNELHRHLCKLALKEGFTFQQFCRKLLIMYSGFGSENWVIERKPINPKLNITDMKIQELFSRPSKTNS